MSLPLRLRPVPALLALGLVATVPVVGPSSANADVSSAPRITATGISTESGGLTPYYNVACSRFVRFTDDSPSDASAYSLLVDGEVVDDAASAQPEGGLSFSGACGRAGTHTVVVRETGTDGTVTDSPESTLRFRDLRGPKRASLNAERIKGVYSLRAGSVARIGFSSPGFEKGTTIVTQVWSSRRRTFTAADFEANRSGSAAVVERRGSKAVVRFTVPKRMVGRWLWISYAELTGDFGSKGVTDWSLSFVPIKVAPAKG
ncbi:hypothetical protein K8Z61_13105 [Nocardioides sp. TRM66260-LWL]|uniref:hypothetical protein n=1 Tax=Nocardioides sp. TRM66260-LWL TaxID=2874478 RepID=UPI001CC353B2|nr:hypothetical protein [Nocardioides sp. TRM66260-LWL]MBZ5735433.1 hypothetical protein [Nocardioides sp. TRM66260-LWL]